MASSRFSVKGLNVFTLIFRYRVGLSVTLAVLLCLRYQYNQSCETSLCEFASISTSKTRTTSTNFSKVEDDIKALIKSSGFLAATRANRGIISNGNPACVVDPAVSECTGMGFGAFLLKTLDHIMTCRFLGSNNLAVFWRACNSVCSRDPRVNSWHWYFEPVNPGLETQVERVLCPLMIMDNSEFFQKLPADLKPILENSFKDRTGVEGYEHSQIINTQERIRINKLIQQYVKPNSRISEKVKTFYNRHLAGYTVLGVHVRGSDHWMETKEKILPPLMSWVKSAKSILETLPQPRKMFIASDNDEVISTFVTFFGKETVRLNP